ncbi:hypothetical protein CXF43_11060 [Corynebacterium bovis]|uniref:Uncharacterized protein n=1 Tax=Corynebacterium bovis TaxID=36808 RepID=A0A3R8R3S3_9CORY|nr:hypothetical protein CXF40_10870 [Corynebacterium bovis]RRO94610.1 hypothetical protein CXF32_08795 [Corynebacterium bovis]RRO94835.1 hypothetical protein CXF31_09425 [Corynebacterium bovis]RRO98943.1 hypothetical protein CXF41_10995 [Corynebacterium bovis]RRO98977.1 hypothetical protein CXF39_09915 [Corynebacterium bovis]
MMSLHSIEKPEAVSPHHRHTASPTWATRTSRGVRPGTGGVHQACEPDDAAWMSCAHAMRGAMTRNDGTAGSTSTLQPSIRAGEPRSVLRRSGRVRSAGRARVVGVRKHGGMESQNQRRPHRRAADHEHAIQVGWRSQYARVRTSSGIAVAGLGGLAGSAEVVGGPGRFGMLDAGMKRPGAHAM